MNEAMSGRRRAYDHRLRELACEEGNAHLLGGIGVPRSTAASWLRRGSRAVVSLDVVTKDAIELQAEVSLDSRRRDMVSEAPGQLGGSVLPAVAPVEDREGWRDPGRPVFDSLARDHNRLERRGRRRAAQQSDRQPSQTAAGILRAMTGRGDGEAADQTPCGVADPISGECSRCPLIATDEVDCRERPRWTQVRPLKRDWRPVVDRADDGAPRLAQQRRSTRGFRRRWCRLSCDRCASRLPGHFREP
jgi:hypothetical protein